MSQPTSGIEVSASGGVQAAKMPAPSCGFGVMISRLR